MSYFKAIPVELVELIVSKLSDEDEQNLGSAYAGYKPEDLLYYDQLNVFNMRYPYLAKILNLKRSIEVDERGFKYDLNQDTYNDYAVMSRAPFLYNYFVTGRTYPGFIGSLEDALGNFKRDGYDFREPIIPILIDVYRRRYPQIFSQLDVPVDMRHFIVALYLIDTNSELLSILTDSQHYDVNNEDIEMLDDEIDNIKKEYEDFIYRSDPREIDGVVGYILKLILNLYQQEGRFIGIDIQDWAMQYINSYRQNINLPLLPPPVFSSYILPGVSTSLIL